MVEKMHRSAGPQQEHGSCNGFWKSMAWWRQWGQIDRSFEIRYIRCGCQDAQTDSFQCDRDTSGVAWPTVHDAYSAPSRTYHPGIVTFFTISTPAILQSYLTDGCHSLHNPLRSIWCILLPPVAPMKGNIGGWNNVIHQLGGVASPSDSSRVCTISVWSNRTGRSQCSPIVKSLMENPSKAYGFDRGVQVDSIWDDVAVIGFWDLSRTFRYLCHLTLFHSKGRLDMERWRLIGTKSVEFVPKVRCWKHSYKGTSSVDDGVHGVSLNVDDQEMK